MNDPWIQSIGGSLIAAAIIFVGKRFLLKNRPLRQIMFGVAVSTAVFIFGHLLQPIAQYV
jgi:ABC-type Fe3+-siderophore transport system permease subunit